MLKIILERRSILDVPPLLPRFYAMQQRREDERKLAKVILETGGSAPAKAVPGATAAGDGRRLRGIPVVGRSTAGGAIPGTDPLRALLAKERGRRR
jgi:hypothetical protein